MANLLEDAEVQSTKFVVSTSRYIGSKVYRYGNEKVLTFEIFKRKPFVESPDDKFMILDSQTEFRPDLISFMAYGVTDFWHQILYANKIVDVYDLRIGRTIRIPNNIGF